MNRVEQQAIYRALDVERLLDDARSLAGLTDFGESDISEPLRMIQHCYTADTTFHETGLGDFRQEIVRELVNRLRFEADLKRHPEILDEDVSDPIVVIGIPRSGTTKTLRMIAADPSLLKTRMWQLINPAPFPEASESEEDPRIRAAYEDSFLSDNKDIKAAHYYDPFEVNEDVWLYDLTFNDGYYRPGRTPSVSFQDWTRTRSAPSDLENYQYARRLVQYLQWQQGGRLGRRWLMKHTGHIGHLDELMAVYPGATLVHVHRHPCQAIPSAAKLSLALWKLRLDGVDPDFVGKYQLERLKFGLDRYMEARERLKLDDRIVDVPYDNIRSNPMPAIRDIYEKARHPLTNEAEALMIEWEQENEQGKHGAHSYSLEEFGLSAELVEDRLQAYISRFITAN